MDQFTFTNALHLLLTWFLLGVGKAIIVCVGLYLTRGKFNVDNDWKTADEFDNFNPNLGTFQRRYITRYTIFGIHWGFFNDEGYVKEFSWWFDWAKGRHNRFPIPVSTNMDKEAFMKYIMRRR